MNNIKKAINMHQSIDKYLLILFYLSMFLLPTNLFLVWRFPESFIQGHFIDYLAPKIYFSQIIIALFGIVWVRKLHITTRGGSVLTSIFGRFPWKAPAGFTALLAVCGILFLQAVRWQDTGLMSMVCNFLVGPGLLLVFLWKEQTFSKKHLFLAVGAASSFQAGVGLLQWFRQDSLFGYMFLGEPNLRLQEIVTSSLPGALRVLPYGTTPHPNILAAWLVLGTLCLVEFWKGVQGSAYKSRIHLLIPLLLSLLLGVLLLTESWVAWISLLGLLLFSRFSGFVLVGLQRFFRTVHLSFTQGVMVLICLIQLGWIVFPLAVQRMSLSSSLLEQSSLTRRSHLQIQSLELLRIEPAGSGLKRMFQHIFTTEKTYTGGRFLQPAHNVGILLITVGGIWVLIVLFLYVIFEHNKYSLFSLLVLSSLPLFSLDHYLISTITGQYILIISYVYLNYSISRSDL